MYHDDISAMLVHCM